MIYYGQFSGHKCVQNLYKWLVQHTGFDVSNPWLPMTDKSAFDVIGHMIRSQFIDSSSDGVEDTEDIIVQQVL